MLAIKRVLILNLRPLAFDSNSDLVLSAENIVTGCMQIDVHPVLSEGPGSPASFLPPLSDNEQQKLSKLVWSAWASIV